jgi:hypothetical protein
MRVCSRICTSLLTASLGIHYILSRRLKTSGAGIGHERTQLRDYSLELKAQLRARLFAFQLMPPLGFEFTVSPLQFQAPWQQVSAGSRSRGTN